MEPEPVWDTSFEELGAALERLEPNVGKSAKIQAVIAARVAKAQVLAADAQVVAATWQKRAAIATILGVIVALLGVLVALGLGLWSD